MPSVLIHGEIAVQFVDLLKENLDRSWNILVWDPDRNSSEEFREMACEADVIIGGQIPIEKWPRVPKLKLFQIPWTGYDFCSPESMPKDVPVCNCFEHESTIAEFVMGAMLEWKIEIADMDRRFRREGWGGRKVGKGLFHGELRSRTVGIIGYGHIGSEIARRATAFDMRVIGIRRSQQPVPPCLDWLGTPERLSDLMQESDFVIVCSDLNRETEGMIGAEEIDEMKADAIIINVARGRIIKEEPLYQSLKNRRIGGAVIDVWYNYIGKDNRDVWPSNFPFQDLDNVILTPHESAWTPEQIKRRWKFVPENLTRLVEGKPLENMVFQGTQSFRE